MSHCRIACKDLKYEQVNRRDGVEDPLAPGVSLKVANLLDGARLEIPGQVCSELTEDGSKTMMHRRPPCQLVGV